MSEMANLVDARERDCTPAKRFRRDATVRRRWKRWNNITSMNNTPEMT